MEAIDLKNPVTIFLVIEASAISHCMMDPGTAEHLADDIIVGGAGGLGEHETGLNSVLLCIILCKHVLNIIYQLVIAKCFHV